MDYFIHLLILIALYIILAQSFNVVFGLGRLFNLAHVAVYAVGAYATALLSTALGYSSWSCVPASCLIGALFSVPIGAISLKLSQEYFAIGTLAFSSVISALLINWKSLTRGVLGIPGIPRPDFFGVDFYNNLNFLYLMIVAVVITLGLLHILFKSAFSRSLRAQAELEIAAQALGKDTVAVKLLSFMISSFFAGFAGSLFAYYLNYIDPSSFMLTEMVFILTIIIVGRPGSFWGVVMSAWFLVLLPEPLRFINIPPSVLGPMRQMLYSIILFIVVRINRARLFPVRREI